MSDVRHNDAALAATDRGQGLSRRQVMTAGFFGILGSQLLLHGTDAPAFADTDLVLEGDGFTIRAAGGSVSLLDGSGSEVQRFNGYRHGSFTLTSGSSALGESEDGSPALVVTWDVPASAPEGASVVGTFVPRGRALQIVYDITSPGATSGSTGMMRRVPVPAGPVVETFRGVADWVRDPRGGIPYQTNAKTLYTQDIRGTKLTIVAPGANSSWRDNGALHLPATTVGEGVFQARAAVVLGPEPATVVEAIGMQRTIAAELVTDRPYNIWESAEEPLVVKGAAYNGGDAREVTFAWVAHDFDGAVVGERRTTSSVPALSVATDELDVRLPGRGIAFVELTVTAGDDECYTRTNIAVLPPHTYEAQTSFFGLAADYLFGPRHERELIKRVGARSSRHAHFSAEELAEFGFTQHRLRTPASLEEFDGDPEALAAYVRSELDIAEAAQATHYECANEWNMRGGVRQGVGAEKYVTKWATAFREEIDRRGSAIKLIPVALAGMDDVYARRMFEAGLADQAHAFNLHPGRGNFVPDFAPTPADWSEGGNGSYWNYYGALTEARRQIDAYAGPEMEFWLTEAYTPTRPNVWWSDTYRTAAENTLLTAVLAPTQGVTMMQWFQFYDNVKANPYGANPDNPEYHYGLLLRDFSPKPHLLALANAAEQLDGATFVRWLDLPEEHARGLLFETPRGPLTVLWLRADGYVLNTARDRDGGFYDTPEPWVDVWPTKATVALAADEVVTEIDAIGRRREIAVTGGTASITLDGAPRMYYGLRITSDSEAGAPAEGVLSTDSGWAHGLHDGNYIVTMNLWWGTNATVFRLYENGELVATEQMSPDTPNAQRVEVAITGRPNGVYTYTGELSNSQGTTATSSVTVRTTDAEPGKPVVSHDNWGRSSSYTVTTNLWWGTNGTAYRLYEDDVLIDEQSLTAASPAAQRATTAVSGRAPGTYRYVAELVNDAGTTRSAAVSVKVV